MRTSLTLLSVSFFAACGGAAGHMETSPDASPDAGPDTTSRCTSTPRRIVDGATFAPSSATTAVDTPNLAVAANTLYYNLAYEEVNGARPGGHLMKVALDQAGAQPEHLADTAHPQRLVILGGNLYFTDDVDGAIYALPLAGGTPTAPVHAGSLGWLAADDTSLYFGDTGGIERLLLTGDPPHHVADHEVFSFGVVAGSLVLADFTGNTVATVAPTGGAVTPVASGQQGPLYPVACGNTTCWLDAGDFANPQGTLVQLTLQGVLPRVKDARLFHPHGVASDGTSVFVLAEGDGNSLTRSSPDGTRFDTIAHATGAGSLAVDDACVYYSAFDGIYSLRKDAAAL